MGALAAKKHGMPVAISFATETDGRLPSGQALGDAVTQVDEAMGSYPAYYMVNCAHPEHFRAALDNDAPWLQRMRGVRANASRMSHAEFDAAETLDAARTPAIAMPSRQLARLCFLGFYIEREKGVTGASSAQSRQKVGARWSALVLRTVLLNGYTTAAPYDLGPCASRSDSR